MKNPVIFVAVVLTSFLSSCNMGEKTFIASSYSGDGAADVLLCRLTGNGSIEKLSDITVGDNPSYLPPEGRADLPGQVRSNTTHMKAVANHHFTL
jgi:hypothetical protein